MWIKYALNILNSVQSFFTSFDIQLASLNMSACGCCTQKIVQGIIFGSEKAVLCSPVWAFDLAKNIVTYYVRAVPGINQDLVVGVSLPLHLLGAMGSWGLWLAGSKKNTHSWLHMMHHIGTPQLKLWWASWAGSSRKGVLPVRHRRGDVSVIQSGMPGKQDNASVAKHTVEKQLRREQQQGEMG